MPNVHTQVINGDECIGTSLHAKINPNFLNLDEKIQGLSSVGDTLINSVTSLSLSASTQFISISTDLYDLLTDYTNLTTDVVTISSNVVSLSEFTYTDLLTTVNDLVDAYDTIEIFALGIPTLTSDIYSNFAALSATASKARAKFGTGGNLLGTSHNVSNVNSLATGIYKVIYSTSFADNNYAITTSSSTSGVVTYTQNVETSGAEIHCIDITTLAYTDAIVSVVVHA